MPYLGAVQLATTTLGSSASSVTFSNIPTKLNGLYLRDLILVCNYSRSDVSNSNAYIKFNNSTSDFTNVQMFGNGSSTASNTGSDGRVATYHSTNGRIYNTLVNIMDFNATDKHKTALSRYNSDDGGVGAFAVRWAQTTGVNSLSFYISSGNFNTGSTFSLYATVRKP